MGEAKLKRLILGEDGRPIVAPVYNETGGALLEDPNLPKVLFQSGVLFSLVEQNGQRQLTCRVMSPEMQEAMAKAQAGKKTDLSLCAMLAVTASRLFNNGDLMKEVEIGFNIDLTGAVTKVEGQNDDAPTGDTSPAESGTGGVSQGG